MKAAARQDGRCRLGRRGEDAVREDRGLRERHQRLTSATGSATGRNIAEVAPRHFMASSTSSRNGRARSTSAMVLSTQERVPREQDERAHSTAQRTLVRTRRPARARSKLLDEASSTNQGRHPPRTTSAWSAASRMLPRRGRSPAATSARPMLEPRSGRDQDERDLERAVRGHELQQPPRHAERSVVPMTTPSRSRSAAPPRARPGRRARRPPRPGWRRPCCWWRCGTRRSRAACAGERVRPHPALAQPRHRVRSQEHGAHAGLHDGHAEPDSAGADEQGAATPSEPAIRAQRAREDARVEAPRSRARWPRSRCSHCVPASASATGGGPSPCPDSARRERVIVQHLPVAERQRLQASWSSARPRCAVRSRRSNSSHSGWRVRTKRP